MGKKDIKIGGSTIKVFFHTVHGGSRAFTLIFH